MFCITACWMANVQIDEAGRYKRAFEMLVIIGKNIEINIQINLRLTRPLVKNASAYNSA